MSDDVLPEARALWAALAGTVTFDEGQRQVLLAPTSRLCPAGYIGVVAIGSGVLVTVPSPKLIASVTELVSATSVVDLVGVATWDALAPDAVLGPARLSYALPGEVEPPGTTVEAVPPGSPDVAALLAGVPADEADESGVDDVTSPVFVERDRAGDVIAASGWIPWPGRTAHVCVLVATTARGEGAEGRVGRAAVAHAGTAGTLAQWQARPGPSSAVARRIGMTDVGAQLSLRPALPG